MSMYMSNVRLDIYDTMSFRLLSVIYLIFLGLFRRFFNYNTLFDTYENLFISPSNFILLSTLNFVSKKVTIFFHYLIFSTHHFSVTVRIIVLVVT